MKNKIFSLILVLALLCNINTVNAVGGGGTGSSSGSGGTGSSGGTTSSYWFDIGSSSLNNTTDYRIDLVYKPKNGGNLKTLKTVVARCGSGYRGPNATRAINNYAKSNASDKKIHSSGRLAELACIVKNGQVTQKSNAGYFSKDNDAVIKALLKEIGADIDELKLEQDENPGTLNSFGYRFLIQQITIWQKGSQYVASPRKEMAKRGDASDTYFSQSWITQHKGAANFQSDIYTERDDIGIYRATRYNPLYSKSNFRNAQRGTGYNIIWFYNPYSFAYDYRPDSLCLNCDDENSNWSYVYSDMANWEGIKVSLNSKDNNVKNYFKQNKKIGNNTVACREQIRVKFPDEGNAIRVETGRYFTVGLPQQYSIGTPNFEPLKVERTKECHAYNGDNDVTNSISDNQWKNFWSNDTFYKNATNKSQDKKTASTGKVTLDYQEENGDGSYNGKKDTDTYNTKVSQNKGNLTVTNSYTLAADTYRYIRKDNGLSVSEVPDVAYTDVGVANFPISYNNTKTDDNDLAATLSFKYEIPKDSSLSKSIGHPNYFNGDTAQTKDEDIYKVANKSGSIGNNYVTKGSLDDNQYNDLKHTACVLEYCDANGQNCKSEFKSCMNNKVKNGKSQTNCASKNYICDIKFEEDENPPEDNVCRQEDGKYYIGENEVTKDEYDKVCSCKIENGKYYIDMEEVTEEEYMAVCPPGERVCPDYDPCCLGYCPPCEGENCINVIYRTIDLNTPFPGYSAEKRQTGANWCSYNVSEKKIICDSYQGSLNTVVDKVIFHNRGVSGNPETEYQEEPIYELTMDADKIKSIQAYNNDHEYSDFTLNCDDKT